MIDGAGEENRSAKHLSFCIQFPEVTRAVQARFLLHLLSVPEDQPLPNMLRLRHQVQQNSPSFQKLEETVGPISKPNYDSGEDDDFVLRAKLPSGFWGPLFFASFTKDEREIQTVHYFLFFGFISVLLFLLLLLEKNLSRETLVNQGFQGLLDSLAQR